MLRQVGYLGHRAGNLNRSAMGTPHHHPRSLVLLPTLFAGILNAQLIHIPDPALRTVYNSWVPGCVDANGDLHADMPEVQAFDGSAHFNSSPVTNVNGLEAFLSLRNLYFTGTGPELTISALPPSLERLEVASAQVLALPALPASLRTLKLNPTYGFSIPPLNEGLERLEIEDIHEQGLLGPLPNSLKELWLSWIAAEITIPPLPTGLKVLSIQSAVVPLSMPDIANTQLERLLLYDLHYAFSLAGTVFPETLRYLYLDSGQEGINAIPPLPAGLDSLHVYFCPWLTELPALPDSLKVAKLMELAVPAVPSLPAKLEELVCMQLPNVTEVPELPHSLRRLYLDDLPINCLPLLPDSLELLELGNTGNFFAGEGVLCLPNEPPNCLITGGNTWLLELCSVMNSLCPSQNPGIGGRVFHDLNINGMLDDGEPGCNYVSLLVEPLGYAGGVPMNGQYDLGLDPGDYTISAVPFMPFVQNVSPQSHSAELPTQTSYTANKDFALSMPVFEDISMALTGWDYCPGFDRPLMVTVTNQGTVSTDVPVELILDADQTFVESWPPPTFQSGNLIQWSMQGLVMGEQRSILVMLHTNPSVPLGTNVSHLVTTGDMPNDIHPENNAAVLETVIVGSYDPNDKTVTPSVIDGSALSTAEFTYTIRFQNTGTYPASRVVITDTLSASLDWSSFRFLASSHAMNWTLFNGVLRFTFDPIFLPDSTNDEANSHGFVRFSMRPNLAAGLSPIGNVANIFFDYNAPVITNEAIVDISTSVTTAERPRIRLFPVPVEQTLWIERGSETVAQATVVDMQGRKLTARTISGTFASLDVSGLPSGSYVLELQAETIERTPFLKY